MLNIPDFDCPHGAAQLILQEVRQSQKAYCLVSWYAEQELELLLEECRRFCRMVGAEQIFALLPEGHSAPQDLPYPVGFQVLQMQAEKTGLGETDAALWPLLPEQAKEYRNLYNQAMLPVDGSRHLREKELPHLLEQGGCYFVHHHGQLLGLGQVRDNEILSVVSCQPGAGATVVRALASVIDQEVVQLSVASTNGRALALYERLGFVKTGVLETWFQLTIDNDFLSSLGATN